MAEGISFVPYVQHDDRSDTIMEKFTLFNEENLLKILGEFSTRKSSGINDIPTETLIDAIHARPDIFVKLCNRSLELGIYPEHCKLARIKVIPKKGDTRMLDNLRPISILSLIGKILDFFFLDFLNIMDCSTICNLASDPGDQSTMLFFIFLTCFGGPGMLGSI